jgi:hypothetical protein
MEDAEWRHLVRDINSDIAGIIQSQRVLEEINEELRDRIDNPVEEDFIHGDVDGHTPGMPRRIHVGGVEIQTRMLHRMGIRQRDIKGADLLYEIAGRKFVIVQYKSPDARNRVHLDRPQLKELMEACPNPCPPHFPRLLPTCGAWYALRSKSASAYLPACKAQEVFDPADSRNVAGFSSGLSHQVFQEIFARCWTGARIAPVEMAHISIVTTEADRILFRVLQRGTFGR